MEIFDEIGKAGTAKKLEGLNNIDNKTTIDGYLMHIPGQHIFFDKYMLSVIHLRDVEGVKPAHKDFPEATHEIMLLVLNPDKNPTYNEPDSWVYLLPVNARVQFISNSDDQAAQVLRLVAKGIVDGILPVEPIDYRGGYDYWTDTVRNTAHHFTHPGEHLTEKLKENLIN